VENEYWKKGINTDEIPWDILCEYGEGDVEKTFQCYQRQLDDFKKHPKLLQLFKLASWDEWVLQEMEWNGLKYDNEKCIEKSKKLQETIQQLTSKLASLYPTIPINFNSPNQLSAFLFGGTVKEEKKELAGFFGPKAAKAGQAKYKNIIVEHQLPQIFQPGKKLESGDYATDEATLKKLKKTAKNKWVIETLLELSKLDKLNGTYYEGMNNINEEMHWPQGMLHGQYNQCIAQTGRLSSSKPNLQNLSGDALEVFVTRYSS
jgi:DNA polymerase I-like protein with 3'-5' exonuclease and polymerase domains